MPAVTIRVVKTEVVDAAQVASLIAVMSDGTQEPVPTGQLVGVGDWVTTDDTQSKQFMTDPEFQAVKVA